MGEDGKCSACDEDYYLGSNGVCVHNQGCTASSDGQCTQSNNDYILKDGVCVGNDGCTAYSDGKCTSWGALYDLVNGVCEPKN